MRSTMDFRQSNFCFFCFASASSTAATSTFVCAAGPATTVPRDAGWTWGAGAEAEGTAGPGVAAEAPRPKIADIMSPNMLMRRTPVL
jgi:hypothetical protein